MSFKNEFIPFNKPFTIGNELEYIRHAVDSGHISANGFFTKKCETFFEEKYKIQKSFLTTSCTDALEMAALLLQIQSGDEVIVPSFSFVSTVNPFVLRGAKIVFADSCTDHPNIDVEKVEELITPKTKVIVCVHYAGMACDMAKLVAICNKHNISLIEDAAHAIESKWNGQIQLGTIGKIGAFSFHETKNVISGEGGLICLNDEGLIERAEIIAEKGTNRSAFNRGEINKYLWVDIGSSFLPSELTAAFLFAQMEKVNEIQSQRISVWQQYHSELELLEKENFVQRPIIPKYAMTNGHIYYLVCKSPEQRDKLIHELMKSSIQAVFHYQALHQSPFYKAINEKRSLENAERFSDCLLRLPLFYSLQSSQISRICEVIRKHFGLAS